MVVFAIPFVFRFDFVMLNWLACVDFCCCVLFVVAFDDVVAG
jgi:hypothetical protein